MIEPTPDQNTAQNRPTTSEKLMMNIRGLEDAIDKNLYRAAGSWLISIFAYEDMLNCIANKYYGRYER